MWEGGEVSIQKKERIEGGDKDKKEKKGREEEVEEGGEREEEEEEMEEGGGRRRRWKKKDKELKHRGTLGSIKAAMHSLKFPEVSDLSSCIRSWRQRGRRIEGGDKHILFLTTKNNH